MQKDRAALSEDERNLLTGNEHVMFVIERLGIKQPTNPAELNAFNERMDEIFGIFDKRDNFAAVRFLEICAAFGLNINAGSDGQRAVFKSKR